MTPQGTSLRFTSVLVFALGCSVGLEIDQTGTTGEASSTAAESSTGEPEPGSGAPASADAVRSVVKKFCGDCHGPNSPASANINYIDDLVALVVNGLVVPGDADGSRLFQRLTDPQSPMPPALIEPRPSPGDVQLIRAWINEGALAGEGGCINEFVGFDDMIRTMNADLIANFDEAEDRRNIRYLTLTHLYNAGTCHRELDLYRAAIAKGVNSLSLQAQITRPVAIDDAETIFRVDLRDYGWDENPNFVPVDLWDTIASINPFAAQFSDGPADDLRGLTGAQVPFQPADSFLQIAKGGLLAGVDRNNELYYRILQIPPTVSDLQKLPFVNVPDRAQAIAAGQAFRVILQDSGVSQSNRAYDCYRGASFGAYLCMSFDFFAEDGDRNLFSNPIDFVADGGEVIFTLPNGLQGYAIFDAAGGLIREASTSIVRDPTQRDSVVRAGISCDGCHVSGLNPKRDIFYELFGAAKGNFSEEERDLIDKLFSDPDGAFIQQEADARQFQSILASLGITALTPEPILASSQQLEANLSLERVAAELGMTAQDLAFELGGLDNAFDKLRVGTMTRDEFSGLYRNSLCKLLPGGAVVPDCL